MWKRRYKAKVAQVKLFVKEGELLSRRFRYAGRVHKGFKYWFRCFFEGWWKLRQELMTSEDVLVEGVHTTALDAYIREVLGSLELDDDAEVAMTIFHEIGNEAVDKGMVVLLPPARVPEDRAPLRIEGPAFPIFTYAVAVLKDSGMIVEERIEHAHKMLETGKQMWQCLRRNERVSEPDPLTIVKAIARGKQARSGYECSCAMRGKLCSKTETDVCPFLARYRAMGQTLILSRQ